MLDRLPDPFRSLLYAGGSRQDRLRDPDRVVAMLDVGPGEVVADLGPGAGHFTLRLARAVEPDGVLYAADADQSTLDEINQAAVERGLTTLRPVLVARDRLELPEPVDLLFVSATYHHLGDRVAYFADARQFLRRGGRVAILEARKQGLFARSWGVHATAPALIRQEMGQAGYRLASTHDVVRGYWYGIFVIGHKA